MAMAIRSPSVGLEYPDSDMEQEIVAILFGEQDREDGEHQDEMASLICEFVVDAVCRKRWWRWKRTCARGRRGRSFSIGTSVHHCHRAVSLLVFVPVVRVLMDRFSKPTGSREEEERAGLPRDPRG